MEFGLGFIFLLLLVGGFTAYQGDLVGMWVGKRRLSILGLRPRYTSRIITVFTGIIIVSFTLVCLILLSDSVRQALFGMESLRSSVLALSDDVTKKNAELASLETQRERLLSGVEQLTDENTRLQKQNSQLQAQKKDISSQNTQLQALNAQLRGERDTLTKRTAALQQEVVRLESDRELLVKQLAELRKAGNYYFDQATRLQQVNANLRQANFIYHALDVIATLVVDTSQNPVITERQLRNMLSRANAQVLAQGVGNQNDGVGLRIDRVVADGDNQLTPISSDTVINLAVEAIHSDPHVQSVIVQLVALTNATYGESFLADFNLIQNTLVYEKNEVVAAQSFDGRAPASQLFEEFLLWLQQDIRQAVSEQGLMPQADGSFGGLPPKQIFEVIDRIASTGRLVEVSAYAVSECWTKGPLVLGFNIRILE